MNHELYLRCHTAITDVKNRDQKPGSENHQPRWAPHVLVLDTETTTDARQSLNFGAYRFCREDGGGVYTCIEEGLFYADDLNQSQLKVLRHYAETRAAETPAGFPQHLKIYSRSDFMEQVFLRAIQANSAVVAFNLPFDLSRLTVEYRVGRRADRRGWSFILFNYFDKKKRKFRPNTFRPRAQLTPKDSKAAFVRLVGGDMDQPYKPGRFIDLKTLVWALRNRPYSLDGACHEYRVPGKLDHVPTGQVTNEEIDYCRGDVRVTVALLNAVRLEFDRYPIDLPPERAYSAASIAKAFLRTMGLTPPKDKFKLADDMHGICMQAYYGGRSECRIRHTSVPLVYLDFTSQYPTVNTHLGLWELLVADKIKARVITAEVQRLVDSITLEQLLDPATWRKLAFFALVEPNDDILPVRTVYGETHLGDDTNIGINPLTSKTPIWFAGPDIIAAKLLGKKSPKILRAIRFEPVGKQKGMHPVKLGTRSIDPYRDNFFRMVIEERKRKGTPEALQYFLKILANAGCYGIYAEVNRLQTGKNSPKNLKLFSGEYRSSETTCILEQPGLWYFPPISALTTAGGRLLLAILERMVTDRGGTYLMCDTDSMAIVANENGDPVTSAGGLLQHQDDQEAIQALAWREVEEIRNAFESLNPYDKSIVAGSILKIEDINTDAKGNRRQLYGYGISAKRYALFVLTKRGLRLIKPSEHGLGLYYRPLEGRDSECNVPLWIKEGWEWIIRKVHQLPNHHPKWFRVPAMRRIAISTPHVMAALRRLDRDKARPYNFALAPVLLNLTGSPCTLLGCFEKDSSRWRGMTYINIHDGTLCTLDPPVLAVLPQTFETVFAQYDKHLESKSLGPDGQPCKSDTYGLLRRYPVSVVGFRYIGKETERGWEHAEDVSTLLPTLLRYEENSGRVREALRQHLKTVPLDTLEQHSGLSRHSIIRARSGQKIHHRTLELIIKACENWAGSKDCAG